MYRIFHLTIARKMINVCTSMMVLGIIVIPFSLSFPVGNSFWNCSNPGNVTNVATPAIQGMMNRANPWPRGCLWGYQSLSVIYSPDETAIRSWWTLYSCMEHIREGKGGSNVCITEKEKWNSLDIHRRASSLWCLVCACMVEKKNNLFYLHLMQVLLSFWFGLFLGTYLMTLKHELIS